MNEYEYAFGQWVLDAGDYKYRYLGKNSTGHAMLYIPGIVDIDGMNHDDIRPDPDPPELVAGQLVMVKIDDEAEWQGPYEYIGCNAIMKYKHIADNGGFHTPTIAQYAKPYMSEPECPAPEPAQLDAIRAELSDLKAHIQKIEQRLPG